MIQSIRVTNLKGESLMMELGSPEKSGLLVRSITGLGPPQASINTYDTATIDGARYVNSRAQIRNIILTLCPIWTSENSLEENRMKAYHFFPIKQEVKFEVITDHKQVYAIGYVESNDADIFSDSETLTISLICPDPYFYQSGGEEEIVFNGIEPMFEFEFSNESLTENLLEMSRINTLKEKTIDYVGDAKIGFRIVLRFVGSVTGNILIYNPVTHETMSIDTSKIPRMVIHNNDSIEISTVPGNKYVKFIRGSTETNILNSVDRTTISWFTLQQGPNTIIYTADNGEDNILFSMFFKPAFQGV